MISWLDWKKLERNPSKPSAFWENGLFKAIWISEESRGLLVKVVHLTKKVHWKNPMENNQVAPIWKDLESSEVGFGWLLLSLLSKLHWKNRDQILRLLDFLIDVTLWKKAVFLSPSLTHRILDLCAQYVSRAFRI